MIAESIRITRGVYESLDIDSYTPVLDLISYGFGTASYSIYFQVYILAVLHFGHTTLY